MLHLILQDHKLVLASASPRRKALFNLLGLTPLVIPAHIHEPLTKAPAQLQAMGHAQAKAQAIAARMDPETVVVGADTLVVLDGRIYGKPEDRNQAAEFLRQLSGRTHKVYTGVCVCLRSQCLCRYERSLVEFAPLSEDEIQAYLDTKEPLDKAGAYGIQGYGSQFIRRVRGCYFNVMGFPVNLFYAMANELLAADRSGGTR